MIKFTNNAELGKWGEQQARHFLESQGYKIVAQNYRCYCGEIDLIAKMAEVWCFIEVKTRRNSRFGYGYQALTPAKQEHLINSAYHYLQTNQLTDIPVRFDVVSIDFHSTDIIGLS